MTLRKIEVKELLAVPITTIAALPLELAGDEVSVTTSAAACSFAPTGAAIHAENTVAAHMVYYAPET